MYRKMRFLLEYEAEEKTMKIAKGLIVKLIVLRDLRGDMELVP